MTEFNRPPNPNLEARDGVAGGASLAVSDEAAWPAVVSVVAAVSVPLARRCLAPSCPAAAAAEAAVASAAVLRASKSLNAVAFALASLAAACCALIPAVISSGMILSARRGAADSSTSGERIFDRRRNMVCGIRKDDKGWDRRYGRGKVRWAE